MHLIMTAKHMITQNMMNFTIMKTLLKVSKIQVLVRLGSWMQFEVVIIPIFTFQCVVRKSSIEVFLTQKLLLETLLKDR